MTKMAISNHGNFLRLKFTDPTLENVVPLRSLFRLCIVHVSFKYIYRSFSGYLLSLDIA